MAFSRRAATLDPDALGLFAKASRAYDAYVTAMGTLTYQTYIEGTIRNAMAMLEEETLYQERARELASLDRFTPGDATAANVARAERASAAAVAGVVTQTAEERKALEASQAAWRTYRDAEVAFYRAAFGPRFGAENVERAIRVRLETRRAREASPPGTAASPVAL